MWSQTHWRWLETKLVELGILGGDATYKVGSGQARRLPNPDLYRCRPHNYVSCKCSSQRLLTLQIFSERYGQMIKHEWVLLGLLQHSSPFEWD